MNEGILSPFACALIPSALCNYVAVSVICRNLKIVCLVPLIIPVIICCARIHTAEDDVYDTFGNLNLPNAIAIGICHIEPLIATVPSIYCESCIINLPVSIGNEVESNGSAGSRRIDGIFLASCISLFHCCISNFVCPVKLLGIVYEVAGLRRAVIEEESKTFKGCNLYGVGVPILCAFNLSSGCAGPFCACNVVELSVPTPSVNSCPALGILPINSNFDGINGLSAFLNVGVSVCSHGVCEVICACCKLKISRADPSAVSLVIKLKLCSIFNNESTGPGSLISGLCESVLFGKVLGLPFVECTDEVDIVCSYVICNIRLDCDLACSNVIGNNVSTGKKINILSVYANPSVAGICGSYVIELNRLALCNNECTCPSSAISTFCKSVFLGEIFGLPFVYCTDEVHIVCTNELINCLGFCFAANRAYACLNALGLVSRSGSYLPFAPSVSKGRDNLLTNYDSAALFVSANLAFGKTCSGASSSLAGNNGCVSVLASNVALKSANVTISVMLVVIAVRLKRSFCLLNQCGVTNRAFRACSKTCGCTGSINSRNRYGCVTCFGNNFLFFKN